ncbi:ABC transporter ATP-binding protein [Candidatus Thorarchaeota archaeon]|nr:MAG: ABC transporter ATP-binding protein [Candidatus Thorarchaeota archaeon]
MYAVELERISKTFPGGVEANKDITLRIEEGEVHGLLGENGAGKSTLMNILYGLISKDEGTVKIKGEKVELHSPQDAIIRGVGMVHQHFKLIPTLSVTENVVLGLEPVLTKFETVHEHSRLPITQLMPTDINGAAKRIKEIGEENGMGVDPMAKIQDISVGQQQRIEIIKTLYREADILILDEPTSVLTPQEVDELFVTLERFRKAGRTIILITHKLREPLALCDRITVLRNGELVGTVQTEDTSREELARMMVGRTVVFETEKGPCNPGDVALELRNLQVKDSRGLLAVNGISLEIRSGEIFGIAGVEGNGQTELVEAIAGIIEPTSGRILVDGNDLTGNSARNIRDAGVSHIPEDRQKRGLVLGFSVKENLALGRHHLSPYATGPMQSLLNFQIMSQASEELVETYSIMLSDIDEPASTLSGGNQQKVVAARELSSMPKVILAAQPTRGLDVGATEYIRNVLVRMRDEGVAILLVSAELDEIMNLADRIGVIYKGRLVAERKPEETSNEELGLLMAGEKSNLTREE